MILYLKDLKNSTRRLRFDKHFQQIPGYKTNIQKIILFLNTNKKLAEKRSQERIPFTVASKNPHRKQNLDINLTKDVKHLYNENYKALKEKIVEDPSRQKDSPWS
jgi:hypothetical protein